MINLERKIYGYQGSSKFEKIIAYRTIVEDDLFIDYLAFFIDNSSTFVVKIDSSGESLAFTNLEEMQNSIGRTGLAYEKESIIPNSKSFDKITIIKNEYGEIVSISFKIEDQVLKISIGLDCLILNVDNRT